MKKILVVLLMLTISLSLCSCGKSAEKTVLKSIKEYRVDYHVPDFFVDAVKTYEFTGLDDKSYRLMFVEYTTKYGEEDFYMVDLKSGNCYERSMFYDDFNGIGYYLRCNGSVNYLLGLFLIFCLFSH